MTKRKALPLALIGSTLAIAAVVWLTSGSTQLTAARPEAGPTPRLAPLFAETEPAKNPIRLFLQDDGTAIHGWVSGIEDFSGKKVRVKIGDAKDWVDTGVTLAKDNTFTWGHKLQKPASVRVFVDIGGRDMPWLDDTVAVTLGVAEKEPSVFFVVDRTAYRPGQALHFAGFLRQLSAADEFEPIAGKDVVVELTSQQKQTKAARFNLKSDDHGRIDGSYVFSDGDSLDNYTLAIPGFKGQAQLVLAEYRKSKIRLKITGDVVGQKLNLKFETLDFLDKPVAASRISFTAQVVQKNKGDKTHPLKGDDFVHHASLGLDQFDIDDLPEDQRLLLQAHGIPPFGSAGGAVAQFNGEIALNGAEPGKHTLDLKKEWGEGNFGVIIQGIVTDANGREQRATHHISLRCESTHGQTVKLDLAKDIFATGEPVTVRLKTSDGKPIEEGTSLVVMQLAAEPIQQNMSGFYDGYYGYGMYGAYNYGYRPYYRRYRNSIYGWSPVVKEEAKRTLVTALPFKGDTASVKLTEPGAYKFVAVTQHDDGSTTKAEAGCVVRNLDDMNPLVLRLDKDSFDAGDRLTGTIHSRFADANVLLTLRDSSGIRMTKPVRLKAGVAALDEPLPRDLHYGVAVELVYLDEKDLNHVTGRFVRVLPSERILDVKANTPEEVKPGDKVKVDIQVDRREEVDLVVSVYDQSLLGIASDKSVDIRNFYLADERIRGTMAAELLRRRLGSLTIHTLVKKAEETLKSDAKLAGTPAGQELQVLITFVRQNKFVQTQQVMTLLRLAGVEATLDPFWANYIGMGNWRADLVDKDGLKDTLASIIEKVWNNGWSLKWYQMGDGIVLHEMHPSYVNVNPRQYFSRNQLMYGMNQGFGYASGPGMMRGLGGFNQFQASGNAAMSFAPEGQGFISHLPPAGGAVPLLNTAPDQGHIGVRRDFSDSAFWNADVRTDKEGKASVEFKVPDSLTNWRVVVTAVSKKMHVGQGQTSFRTFKPIMVWPMLPRTFTEGDRVELFASVHNRTDEPQTMKVRLRVENGEVLTPEERVVEVPAKGNVPVYWTFQARLPGFTQLLMSVDCPAGSDASLKRLPVLPCRTEDVVTKSGRVKKGTVFHLPDGIDLDSARFEISFAPSLAADMADTLNYLVDYPYGCVEQTMSRFLPAIKVAQVLQMYQVDHPELNKKLPGCVAGGIKRLLELQQPDGGWGWQGSGQTHEMMTPYALYGLLQAEKAGYKIPNEGAIERGLTRLRVFIDALNADQQVADRIYCMYVYAHRKDLDPAWFDWLSKKLSENKLSDYALALSLEMCVQKEKKDLAERLANALRDRAKKDVQGQVTWTTAGFSRWMEDKFEITAAAMKALVAYDKDDPLIDGILGFFAATKRGDRWNSTKDTAMILYALCDYLAKANYNPSSKNTLTFTVNGGKPVEVKFDDKLTKKITLPGTDLKAGDNKLVFNTEMSGVMYRMALRYWTVGKHLKPEQKGIEVQRKLFLLDDKGKTVRELKSGDSVPRGSYLLSEVTAVSKVHQDMRFVLVENPKPGTAEVIPADDARFANVQPHSGYALREERLASVAFHHEVTGQQFADRCVLLAELSGEFVVSPAYVELMYQTETRGHSGSFVLKVTEEQAK